MPDSVSLHMDTRKFRRFIDRLVSQYERRNTGHALERVAEEFLKKARDRTPHDTGRAQRGWRIAEKKLAGRNQYVLIENDVFYVRFLEYGTVEVRPQGMLRLTGRELRARWTLAKELQRELQAAVRTGNRGA